METITKDKKKKRQVLGKILFKKRGRAGGPCILFIIIIFYHRFSIF